MFVTMHCDLKRRLSSHSYDSGFICGVGKSVTVMLQINSVHRVSDIIEIGQHCRNLHVETGHINKGAFFYHSV